MRKGLWAIVVTLAAPAALFAQGKGQDPRTPDKDPFKKKADPAVEFKKINAEAERHIKSIRSFTARWERGGAKGTLKAKYISGKVWVLLEEPENPDGRTMENVAEKEITEFWPKSKEFRRTNYRRAPDRFPLEVLYGWQYRPSKLDDDFTLKPVRLAIGLAKTNPGGDKYKGDDPFAKKRKGFEERGPESASGPAGGPDPKVHHVVELVPKSAKLCEKISAIRLHVHYKNFTLSRIELRPKGEGASAVTVDLSDYKIGVELKKYDVMIRTAEWKKRS